MKKITWVEAVTYIIGFSGGSVFGWFFPELTLIFVSVTVIAILVGLVAAKLVYYTESSRYEPDEKFNK
jgi:uncharacterized ion transporter superfamily protein YfcC